MGEARSGGQSYFVDGLVGRAPPPPPRGDPPPLDHGRRRGTSTPRLLAPAVPEQRHAPAHRRGLLRPEWG